jgi:NAD+-dependent protein deacetylase sirtuin 4
VLDLHGSLARVRCMGCGSPEARKAVQERLRALNPGLGSLEAAARSAPDGDAQLPAGAWEAFRVPSCRRCRGVLKPDVVFFGENVPRPRVREAWDLYEKGHSLLVVGSSLTVFSGRRFTLRAARDGRPVGIVNLGPTRGDEVSRLKVEDRVGRILPRVVALLN